MLLSARPNRAKGLHAIAIATLIVLAPDRAGAQDFSVLPSVGQVLQDYPDPAEQVAVFEVLMDYIEDATGESSST